MSRLVPHPVLSAALLVIWLLLTQLSLGNLFLGTVVALIAGRAFSALELKVARPHRIWPLVRLAAITGLDIIRSNIAVAGLILTNGRHGARRSAFVEIPLRLRDPAPLAMLSMIVTATPGTAWLAFDSERGILLLHVFDVIDEEGWRSLIRDRYEALLLEAFG